MKKILKIIVSAALITLLLIVVNAIYCNNVLEAKNYNLTNSSVKKNIKIVLISDQHNHQFGKDDNRLVEKISEQKPDIIAVCGDMVTDSYANDDVMKNLLTKLVNIAPTYCCLGNHERNLLNQLDIKDDITGTGAVLLDNESVIFEKDNEKFLIGGLSDYPYYEFNDGNENTPEKVFWKNFCNLSNEYYSILLNHEPEYISNILNDSNIDLVFCGHTHGGLVRIPFVGGMYAPNQGWFPKYDKGEFDFENTKMIITAGLGNSNFLPRINNCAEICVININ